MLALKPNGFIDFVITWKRFMKNYLSIDIGGTEIKFAKLDSAGNIIEKDKIATDQDKAKFLENIDQIVNRYISDIKGIGFCAPGKIENTKIRFGGALPFLDGIDFAEIYGKKYHIAVAVINDGKASVLAENWLGSLKGEQNCAAITLGTGVGGGIIIDGHLLRGTHYQAGELSFMINDLSHPDNMQGSLGNIGSAVNFIKKINHKLNYPKENDGLHAFEAIKEKSPDAVNIFQNYCLTIAGLILNIQTVVDVEKIAIGGGISAQPILISGINKEYDKLVQEKNPIIGNTLTKPAIVSAHFRNDSNLYGSLYNLLLQINRENKY